MSRPLRVLIVEDSEDDAALLLRELRRGGYDPIFERVETAEAVSAALDRQTWDIVISDYVMPNFSGLAALTLFKERGLDLPFIIVSGRIGEDVAVAAMRAGAHDYILKGNLARLVPATDRELREAAERRARTRAEKALFWESRVNASIAELSRALIAPASIEDISVLVLKHAKDLTGSRFGYVGHIDPQTGYLIALTHTRDIWDVCEVPDKTTVYKEFSGLWGWVLTNRKPLLTNNPGGDPRSSGTPEGHIPIERFLSVPAMIGEMLVGQVSLANSERDYTEQDVEVVKQLALLYAIAIQRKRAEEAIRESEERYRSIFENITDIIYRTDREGRLTLLNPAGARSVGYSSVKEVIGKNIVEQFYYNADDREDFIRELKKHGEVKNYEIILKRKDGTPIIVETDSHFIYDEEGKPVGIEGITRDITERKRAEEALRSSEERYRTLFESSRDAIGFPTKEGNFIEVNQAWLDIFGYSREEMMRTNVRKLYADPAERPKFLQVLEEKGSVKDYETKLRKKDGTEMDCLVTSTVRWAEGGSVLGYQTIIRDITEEKRLQQEIMETKEFLENLISHAGDAINSADREGRITLWNSAAEELYGYTREEVIGRHFLSSPLVPEARAEEAMRLFELPSRGKVIRDLETQRRRKDGSLVWVSITNTPIRDRDGQWIGNISIHKDITEHKRAEETLLIYQEKLRHLASELSLTEERERRNLAMNLHDHVGQMLAISKMKLEVLRESVSSTAFAEALDEIRELMEQIIHSTRSLIFDLSAPILYELGFEAAVHWLVEQFQKQHGIMSDFQNDGQSKPLDDDIRVVLFQGVRELLVNVARHAKARNVKVSICRDGDNIRINVEDDGVGFDTSGITSPMDRTDRFGLFSIRERLAHLGGHLEIESQPGRGTAVTLVAELKPGREITGRRET